MKSRTIIFGIPNCDVTRAAMKWLKENRIESDFFNYKESVPDAKIVASWIKALGLEKVLNKRSTTWRKLSASLPMGRLTDEYAIDLMQQNPSLIKRPILMRNSKVLAGFDEVEYKAIFDL